MVLRDRVQLLHIEMRCDRGAAATVRAAIGELDHLGWIAGDAMLVASELVTHVVTHAGCDERRRIAFEVTETRDAVTISVHDPTAVRSAASPAHRPLEQEGGLGLIVVDGLARQWGTDHDRGYRAWAELVKV